MKKNISETFRRSLRTVEIYDSRSYGKSEHNNLVLYIYIVLKSLYIELIIIWDVLKLKKKKRSNKDSCLKLLNIDLSNIDRLFKKFKEIIIIIYTYIQVCANVKINSSVSRSLKILGSFMWIDFFLITDY